ncbi:MAG: methylmalonyl-CoA decarboxylase subunit alpha [Acidimicrobiia bacterium]|nr:methylmalonyl-CoA decarboxylase subunit alpha [Acidimicrobiia bacterium]
MPWDEDVAELRRREEFARGMGGPESVAFQHSRGKLTVRERLALLADDGSLREFGGLRGQAHYDERDNLVAFTPKGEVNAVCQIDGRKVVVTAGDFTVRGGSASGGHGGLGEELRPNERALEWRLPLIRLLDAAGGSVRGFEELGRTYVPDGNIWSTVDAQLLSQVPVVSAVMGSVAGLPAVNACMAHFNVMVEGTSQLFPGGPPVVKAALGYDVSKEELGGPEIHTRISGSVDNLAATEKDAVAQIRQFLSYLPSSVHEVAPRIDCDDPTDRTEPELRSLIPRDPRRIHNARRLLDLVLDRGSLFEIAPGYGRSRITGLARLGGYPVGVMANNPMHLGGATDVAGGNKVIRLLQLCDTFHLPLVSLADEPGFLVGIDSERAGIERAGARLVSVSCLSRMPWITVVLRRLYGVAGQCQHRPTGMFRRYAWPSANWGSMHIAGGASAAYRREIASAPDPAAKQAEIEDRLRALASPFRTAEATGQDIIDPAETRPLLCEFVEDAQRILAGQLGPSPLPYLP